MIGKIKAIGLAIVAMAAMSAFAASAAQAGELDVGLQPASLFAHNESGQQADLVLQKTGSQPGQNEFPVRCSTATLEGTTQGQKINEATFTATYSGNPNCTAFGVAATVQMNGCKYTITGAGQPANTAMVDVAGCTLGKTIAINTAICTLDIWEQTALPHVVATNINAQQVTLAATVIGIKVQQTGAACPDGNNHTGTNARFSGNTNLIARVDTGCTPVIKHSHEYCELKQTGAQTTIQST